MKKYNFLTSSHFVWKGSDQAMYMQLLLLGIFQTHIWENINFSMMEDTSDMHKYTYMVELIYFDITL